MAAASAYHNLGKPAPTPVAIINLQQPADHVFCVVGPPMLLQQLSNDTIDDLVVSPATNDVRASDQWLNIFSKLEDYPARSKEKFNKWHLANKRIAWNDGPQGAGWYPALGDYSEGFAAAKLEVILG